MSTLIEDGVEKALGSVRLALDAGGARRQRPTCASSHATNPGTRPRSGSHAGEPSARQSLDDPLPCQAPHAPAVGRR